MWSETPDELEKLKKTNFDTNHNNIKTKINYDNYNKKDIKDIG